MIQIKMDHLGYLCNYAVPVRLCIFRFFFLIICNPLMSAILLTYSSQRETSLKEQEKATQPSASVVCLCSLLHSCDLESEFKGKKTVALQRLCSGSWDYSVQMHVLTPVGEKSGGDVLLVTEVKPRFIRSHSRAD